MRHLLLLALVTAGCTADIGSGAYFCGPNAACPDSQACDGPTNTCVLPSLAAPFSCQAPVTTQTLGGLTCVSNSQILTSCVGSPTDVGDYVFDVPASCTAVAATAKVAFPIAFGAIGLSVVADADGTVVATDTTCHDLAGAGEAIRCITASVTPGARYHLKVAVAATQTADCGGACDFNNYAVTFQLGSP